MSITIYTGLPGSGKSYTVVSSVILPALKEGRKIITNIPLELDVIEQEFGNRPTNFDVSEITKNPKWFDAFPAGALLVLDEVWRIWPSGLKTNNVEQSHKEFLAEHRHQVGDDGRSTEIVLVSQDVGQLASFVRQLIEKTYRAKKLDVLGQPKRYRLDIYEGAVAGANPPVSKRVREMYGEYKPEVYRLYKSHTKSQTGEAGNEQKADDRANILKGGKIKAILVALVVLPIIVFFLGRSTWAKYHPEKKNVQPVAASSAAVEARQPLREKGFLDGREVVIVWNMYSSEGRDFRFRVTSDGVYTVVGLNELYVLGYEVKAINECLVEITGHGLKHQVMCTVNSYRDAVASTIDNISGKQVN